MDLRLVNDTDVEGIGHLLGFLDLFPPQMLPHMMQPYLEEDEATDTWCVACSNDEILGFAYCGEEMLTEGAYNIYALGVHPDAQSKGIGRSLMDFVEEQLRAKSARIVVVEASSTDMYEKSRTFYTSLGYTEEARIRDFWGEGDDKIVYWKNLRE